MITESTASPKRSFRNTDGFFPIAALLHLFFLRQGAAVALQPPASFALSELWEKNESGVHHKGNQSEDHKADPFSTLLEGEHTNAKPATRRTMRRG